MTDGLFQQPEPDGFQNESPIRAFTDFKVEGNYAIGKGFRPSLAHLAAYLDAMQSKEGWALLQVLEAATAPTLIFERVAMCEPPELLFDGHPFNDIFIVEYATMSNRTIHRTTIRDMPDWMQELMVPNRDEDKREPSIHMLHKVANGLRQVTDDIQAGMTIDGEIADKPAEWVDRLNGHTRELEIEIGVNPSVAEAIRKIDLNLDLVDTTQCGLCGGMGADHKPGCLTQVKPGRRDDGIRAMLGLPGLDQVVDDLPTVFCDDGVTDRDDPINPKHYAGRECADIGERLSANGYQVLKYCWRLGKKDDPCQELGKAIWYGESEAELLRLRHLARAQGWRLQRPNVTGIKDPQGFLEDRIVAQNGFTQCIARMLWEGYGQRDLQAILTTIRDQRVKLECGNGLAV